MDSDQKSSERSEIPPNYTWLTLLEIFRPVVVELLVLSLVLLVVMKAGDYLVTAGFFVLVGIRARMSPDDLGVQNAEWADVFAEVMATLKPSEAMDPNANWHHARRVFMNRLSTFKPDDPLEQARVAGAMLGGVARSVIQFFFILGLALMAIQQGDLITYAKGVLPWFS